MVAGNDESIEIIEDEFSGRAIVKIQCCVCKQYFHQDDIIWIEPNSGKLSWEHGNPYCEDHAP